MTLLTIALTAAFGVVMAFVTYYTIKTGAIAAGILLSALIFFFAMVATWDMGLSVETNPELLLACAAGAFVGFLAFLAKELWLKPRQIRRPAD